MLINSQVHLEKLTLLEESNKEVSTFKYIKNDLNMLEREPFKKLTQKRELMAFKHYGFWQCMDTMRDKKILNKLLKEKKAPWLNQKKK